MPLACVLLLLGLVAAQRAGWPGDLALGAPEAPARPVVSEAVPEAVPGAAPEVAPAVAPEVAPLPAMPAAEAPDRVFLDINPVRLQLKVYIDSRLVRTYPIAAGKPSTTSPTGIWAVREKSRWGGGFGTRWMGLDVPWGTYGVHGTSNPASIGLNVSGGCIRLQNRDVEELFEVVQVGVPVRIAGGPPCAHFGEVRREIRAGAMGTDVAAAQRVLWALGLYAGRCDGYYGGGTAGAVRAFQRARGLPVTGNIDSATYDLLGIVPAAEDPALQA
jgi:lipoprotein-anchoring transpeptidase ErfK/SrfK